MGKRIAAAAALALGALIGLALLWGTADDEVATAPEGPASVPGPLPADLDLEALRAELPDNWYWRDGAPTDDPAELGRREADALNRNERFGAIQAGLASEAEIRAYYEERRRISADAVAFATAALRRHGASLSERDQGLLELAREMNGKRLEQLPSELQRALDRKRTQDEARAAWNTQGGQ